MHLFKSTCHDGCSNLSDVAGGTQDAFDSSLQFHHLALQQRMGMQHRSRRPRTSLVSFVGAGCLVAGVRATYWDPASPTCELSASDTAVRIALLTAAQKWHWLYSFFSSLTCKIFTASKLHVCAIPFNIGQLGAACGAAAYRRCLHV